MIYRTCPRCGANLDPVEICDCLEVEARALIDHVAKKELPGATNTEQLDETLQDT